MMAVEPTCRFCGRKLLFQEVKWPNFHQPEYKFRCLLCYSTQFYTEFGKALTYWFDVGKYRLYFYPHVQKCDIFASELHVTTLNFLPHNLTPKNTTEEKIQLLITFS